MDQKCINLEGKIMGYEKKTLAMAAVILIVALGAFYVGAKYEKHKLGALGLLINKSANKKEVANSIKGTVTAKDDAGVTIKLTDGTTKTIPYSASMTFGANGVGSAADIFEGELLVITGEENADGIFVATNMRASKKSPKPAPVTPADNMNPEANTPNAMPTTPPAPSASAPAATVPPAKTMPAPIAK